LVPSADIHTDGLGEWRPGTCMCTGIIYFGFKFSYASLLVVCNQKILIASRQIMPSVTKHCKLTSALFDLNDRMLKLLLFKNTLKRNIMCCNDGTRIGLKCE
jgi:hypothetical protein